MKFSKLSRFAGTALMTVFALTNVVQASCLWYWGSEKMPASMTKNR